MTKAEQKLAKAIVKEFVINRDGYMCKRCGSTKKGLHLCHIYPEGQYERMAYMPDNTFLACFRCHLEWWHKNPIEAYRWYIKKFDIKTRRKLDNIIKRYDEIEKPRYQTIKDLLSEKTK